MNTPIDMAYEFYKAGIISKFFIKSSDELFCSGTFCLECIVDEVICHKIYEGYDTSTFGRLTETDYKKFFEIYPHIGIVL